MDTVLGLSVTPTTVGWVLAEGHGADGAILDHHESQLHGGRGVLAVHSAAQVAQEVLRAQDLANQGEHRLRIIGVTWNDDASAQAALLLEALTDAGFDNVVPVRLLDAVETLAEAIAPVIGYEQTAVCLLEHESATVVMVDTQDGQNRTAIKHVRGGFDGLTSWLTGMFDRSAWRPAAVVVVGSDDNVSGFSWQLEKTLPVPVFAQTMAQVTIARGAALAAAQSTEFTDLRLVAPAHDPVVVPRRSRRYAGAATTLGAAAVTFVASVSLALGLQLTPDRHPEPSGRATPKSTPQIAEAVAPAVPTPVQAQAPAPAPHPTTQREPVRLAADEQVTEPAPDEQPNGVMHQQNPGDGAGSPLLTRVLKHIPGSYGEQDAPPPE
ncbi:hypothetical protein [Mycobacterium basiliense]|uniref:DUF7159 family protein n=1 Tax=Mycobacterium basiliense TaxID=2094119 RepID=UPI001300DFD9|nr:hypothetical protein [Mycobacterium basiliense]